MVLALAMTYRARCEGRRNRAIRLGTFRKRERAVAEFFDKLYSLYDCYNDTLARMAEAARSPLVGPLP